jgi:hypothetical protein
MLAEQFLRDELNKFAKYVVQQARTNLSKGDEPYGSFNDTKNLYNSLGFTDPSTKGGRTSVAFKMADYGKFKDKGVKGKSSSAKAPNSPYRFGTGSGAKGGLTKSMEKYVKRKGIQFRERRKKGEKGRFLSYESTAFIIARSIYQKGTKASMFFTKPFEAAFKRLPDELIEAYSIGLEKQIQVNINKK